MLKIHQILISFYPSNFSKDFLSGSHYFPKTAFKDINLFYTFVIVDFDNQFLIRNGLLTLFSFDHLTNYFGKSVI